MYSSKVVVLAIIAVVVLNVCNAIGVPKGCPNRQCIWCNPEEVDRTRDLCVLGQPCLNNGVTGLCCPQCSGGCEAKTCDVGRTISLSRNRQCPQFKCVSDCSTINVEPSECQDDKNCFPVGKSACCTTCCGRKACF